MRAKHLIWILVALLAILHQDFWWWDDGRPLVLGFVPIGLFYHALFSVAASCLWAAAVCWAWPRELEAWADEAHGGQSAGESRPAAYPIEESTP